MRDSLRALGAALVHAVGPALGRPPDPADVARGGMFLPAIGLAIGALAVLLADALAGRLAPAGVGLAVAVFLGLASGLSLPLAFARGLDALATAGADRGRALHRIEDGRSSAGEIVFLLAVLALKWLALAALAGGALRLALLLAPMLGRWAIVVQAYGSLAARPVGLAAVLVRDLKFREFGIASVTAMAATLMLADAIGLVLLLAVGTLAVSVRILVHRWLGGVTETTISAAGELGETSTLLLCALLARLLG